MGFFRQWLHFQEVDQQLRAQLALREQELAQIQAQTESLLRDTSYTRNTLLQQLLTKTHQQATKAPLPISQPTETTAQDTPPIEYDRARLEKQLNAYAAIDAQQNTASTMPRRGTSDITDPQLKIPWWLRSNFSSGGKDEQATNPVDQNSTRTDALVQRWFSRWGQQVDELIENQEEQKP
jgi:hypothetical protein